MARNYISRAEIKSQAKASLKGNWGKAILASLLVGIIAVAISMITFTTAIIDAINDLNGTPTTYSNIFSFVTFIITVFVIPPISFGLIVFFLKLSRNENPNVGIVFSKFNLWGKCIVLTLLIAVKIFLWTLLFYIPGIIAAYRYSMAFFILADNENISATEAINQSKELMKGNKGQLFVLELSFIGWALLCVLTLYIGFLWLTPYMQITFCNFYNKLKEMNEPTPVQNPVENLM